MPLLGLCPRLGLALRIVLYVLSGAALFVALNLAVGAASSHRWLLGFLLAGYVSTLALLVAWRMTQYAGSLWE